MGLVYCFLTQLNNNLLSNVCQQSRGKLPFIIKNHIL